MQEICTVMYGMFEAHCYFDPAALDWFYCLFYYTTHLLAFILFLYAVQPVQLPETFTTHCADQEF